MNFVLDTSVTLTWCFADEATTDTIALLDQLETKTAIVPSIWSLEVGNILVAAEKRKRIKYADIAEFLALLENLNIQTDNETAQRGFKDIIFLTHSEKLTTYDAAYLELAMRLGLPLATRDAELQSVAKRLGVKVI